MKKYLLLSLFFSFLLISCSQSQTGQKMDELNPQAFADELKGNREIILLDVRTPSEMMNGFIEGAKNLDYNAPGFEKSLDSLDHSKKYFVYCAVGKRSGKAQQMMKNKGFANTVVLEGGLNAWVAAGLPVSKP